MFIDLYVMGECILLKVSEFAASLLHWDLYKYSFFVKIGCLIIMCWINPCAPITAKNNWRILRFLIDIWLKLAMCIFKFIQKPQFHCWMLLKTSFSIWYPNLDAKFFLNVHATKDRKSWSIEHKNVVICNVPKPRGNVLKKKLPPIAKPHLSVNLTKQQPFIRINGC